jgi:hypothetical protein
MFKAFTKYRVALAGGVLLLAALVGCSSGPTAPGQKLVPLTLATQGVSAPTVRLAAPIPGTTLITSDATPVEVTFSRALLVVRDVRFILADGGYQDTTGSGQDDTLGVWPDGLAMMSDDDSMPDGDQDSLPDYDEGGSVIFRGPFVLDLLDSTAQALDTLMVPAGDYHHVQGHLRMLRASDPVAAGFDPLVGSTVWIEGTIGGEGGGPFTFLARIDTEFQIRGRFTVDADTPAVGFITFDVSKWLAGRDGRFLDPRVPENAKWIEQAIRHSVKVGMDDDHDGEMDDRSYRMSW